MAKSDSRFEYQANLNRTDFDLSQKLGFTSAAGMLLPCWYDFASPGDSYYMQHDLPLLRSAVLASPAMVDVKVHFETFFVPMQMILQPFENCLFSLKNLQSTNFLGRTLTNNAFPLFDYAGYISDIHTNYELADIHVDAFRISDLLGLNAPNFLKSVSSPSTDPRALNNLFQYTPNFFPYQLLAYHTIFQYYYRLDDKSDFDSRCCNMDSSFGSSSPVYANMTEMMRIHQRPWDFDYFTSMYRSPIVSDANLQSMVSQLNLIDSVAPNSSTKGYDAVGSAASNNKDSRFFGGVWPTSFDLQAAQRAINTASVRLMFANEKLAMITGRTKKNYDSQVLAHYGVSVPHDVKHDITMIHHDMYELNVQEVTNLAASSTNPLGELAGKSYAYGNGKQFKFTAPCHGVIMTIFSVEPRKRYFGGFDKLNAVTNAFDFPTPEFDRLGNTPMYRYETGMIPSSSQTMADLIGWKERYYQNKRKYDKTTYAFGHGITSGSVNNYSTYMLSFRPFAPYEPYPTGSSSSAARPDLENRFYIERNAMDALCTVAFHYGWLEGEDGSGAPSGENWSVTPWLVYARDPFIINSNIKCKKVSWMSKDGEPIYNY